MRHGFSFADAGTAFARPTGTELFRFDQLYRTSMRPPSGRAHGLGSCCTSCATAWKTRIRAGSSAAEPQPGQRCWKGRRIAGDWKLARGVNQQHFFERQVAPAFDGGAKRVFVVISDAFRFEAAPNWCSSSTARAASRHRWKPCWACCPATPRWAWPPAAAPDAGLQRQRLAGRAGRWPAGRPRWSSAAILAQAHGGIAIKADDLMALGKDKGRELVRDQRDLRLPRPHRHDLGDKQASETKTFEAAAQTVLELSQLVGFIINSLNGSTVLVTADHGFIYQESAG
jgi:hypothetical protein